MSNSFTDNLYAIRMLTMLCTPFSEMPAYKAGVIDEKGKYIVSPNDRTAEQKSTVGYIDRLIINVKKLINKLPGGESKLKNIVAGMVLIKENVDHQNPMVDFLTESELTKIQNDLDGQYSKDRNRMIELWQEYIKIKEECGVATIGASAGSQLPANNTMGIATYDTPLNSKSTVYRRKPKTVELL